MRSDAIDSAARRIREAIARPLEPQRIASAIARAIGSWRYRDAVAAQIAGRFGFSTALMNASIDALLRPFSSTSLDEFARRVRCHPRLVAFVMAGNAAGAGIHEILLALIAGAGALVKTASSEPIFFAALAAHFSDIDPGVGARLAVFNWSRDCRELTYQLTDDADIVVAYGDDSTISALAKDRRLVGFGSRVSGAIVAPDGIESSRLEAIAVAIALDTSLYEQLGCLSAHHVFIVDSDRDAARRFARRIAAELQRVAARLPSPSQLPLNDAAAIRRVREVARWRALGGERVELMEGPRLDWTVVFEPDAAFSVSPGYRTLFVSVVPRASELVARLQHVAPYLESLAIAADENNTAAIDSALKPFKIPRLCVPGEMQSPPIEWRHGGGAFIDMLTNPR